MAQPASKKKSAKGRKAAPAKPQRGANSQGRRKNVLGRGLSSLMSSTVVSVEPEEEVATSNMVVDKEVVKEDGRQVPKIYSPAEDVSDTQITKDGVEGLYYLDITQIIANPEQPRRRFAETELEELVNSIKSTGLLQPILVRKNKDELTFEIVAGERRFRAAKRAELKKIPAIVREITDQEALELGIVENVQRADLNPIEEAEAYQRLIEDFGQSQAEVAKTVGKDRASIANTLRLLKLQKPIREMLINKQISAGHARAILMIESPEVQRAVAKRIIVEGLSVRATERLVSEVGKGLGTAGPRNVVEKSPAVRELEDRLRRTLGTKVTLNMDKKAKGDIRISFFSADELDAILERLGA